MVLSCFVMFLTWFVGFLWFLVVLSAVEAWNLEHWAVHLFQASLPSSVFRIRHGKVITHALAGDTEPQLLPIAEVHMRSEESRLFGPTMGNVLDNVGQQKKHLFIYWKRGVLCQNLGPQLNIGQKKCVQLLWSMVFMAKHDHCSRCPSFADSFGWGPCESGEAQRRQAAVCDGPSTGSTAKMAQDSDLFTGVPPKYSKHSSMTWVCLKMGYTPNEIAI